MLRARQRVKKLHTREITNYELQNVPKKIILTLNAFLLLFEKYIYKNCALKSRNLPQILIIEKKIHHIRQFVSFIHLFCLIIAILNDFTPKILIYSYLVFHVKKIVSGRNRLIKRDNIT